MHLVARRAESRDPCREKTRAARRARRLASGDESACRHCGGVLLVDQDQHVVTCVTCREVAYELPQPEGSVPADIADHASDVCTRCFEPFDQALIDADFTDHGEEPAA